MFRDACDRELNDGRPLVVKLGGSLTRYPSTFHPVLMCLATARRPFALVTGGGAFADQVRAAQPELGFADETAHRMALLALNQTAWMAAAFLPGVLPLESAEEIAGRLVAGRACVWMPFRDCLRDPDLPANWDATSDAVAVRLAQRLGDLPVVFIKSRAPGAQAVTPGQLVDDGLIDSVSGGLLSGAMLPFTIIVAQEAVATLGRLLMRDANGGAGVHANPPSELDRTRAS